MDEVDVRLALLEGRLWGLLVRLARRRDLEAAREVLAVIEAVEGI